MNSAVADETVNSCGTAPNEVFTHAAAFGIGTYQNCNVVAGAYLDIATPGNTVPAGQHASWQATAPWGLMIKNVTIPAFFVKGVNDGKQYGGSFYWHANGVEVYDGGYSEYFGVNDGDAGFPSPYFGFQVICGANPCTTGGAYFFVEQAQLDVEELVWPRPTAGGLWGQQGWVRGDWPLSLSGDSPAGVCSLLAAIDGQSVDSESFPRDTSAWHQCNAAGAGGMHATVHTTQFSNGGHQLLIFASDAAGLNTGFNYVTTIHVDNDAPTVSMSGPTSIASTDGTAYVTATASESPSGVYGLSCQVDGGPPQWYPGASAQVSVSGVGEHAVQCWATSNAVNGAGQHDGWSDPATWTVRIGDPTVSAIGFQKIVNLSCRTVRQRVKIPAHLVTVRRHHKLVRIRVPAHVKVQTIERCHPRIVWRRETVWVTVRRHGQPVRVRRTKRVRVGLPPHAVMLTQKRVSYGHGTTVSGWLGTTGGVALAGQPIRIMAAVDNGQGRFSEVATATTRADGSWGAWIGPGPSRLIEAVYDGSPTLLPTSSATVRTIVPAKVKITITPTIVPWGSEIRVTGRVLGGYVPTNSTLLRLNVGIGRIGRIEGLPDIQPDGRFLIVWKFVAGRGVIHPWFSVGTLAEAAFPYAPGTSKRVLVTLGEPTPPPPPASARHRHRAERHTHRRQRR